MNRLISLEATTLGYGRHVVLRGIDLDLHEGEVVGFVGPNGGGKTTILRTVLGIIEPIQGTVCWHRQVRLGYVPQRSRLDARWPLRSLDVVVMGLYRETGIVRRPTRMQRDEARSLLEYVGVGHAVDRHFSELSGGQQQRVLLARALITKPEILVLDEPSAGLDVAGTAQLLRIVSDLHRERGLTVLLSSHDLNAVANHVDRVALVLEDAFRVGRTDEVITSEALSDLYAVPVDVARIDGRAVVVVSAEGGS